MSLNAVMKYGWVLVCTTALLVLILNAHVPAYAQSDQGQIVGTIKDASGAVIPGVDVTVKNERTGELREVVSNETGYYVVAPLKPSTYAVTATLSGFTPVEFSSVQILVGQRITLNAVLRPQGNNETVEVAWNPPPRSIRVPHESV